jgi:hypothetical protein
VEASGLANCLILVSILRMRSATAGLVYFRGAHDFSVSASSHDGLNPDRKLRLNDELQERTLATFCLRTDLERALVTLLQCLAGGLCDVLD